MATRPKPQRRRPVAPQTDRERDPQTGHFLPGRPAPVPTNTEARASGALSGIDELRGPRPAQPRRDTLPPPSEQHDPDDDFDDDDIGGDDDDGRDPDPGDEERLSRDQESRAFNDVHDEGDADYDDDWSVPTLLEAPEPRPGHVQRWVRTYVGNNPDNRNYQRAHRLGWQPRKADTVPKHIRPPTIAHGEFKDYIVVEGMVLMERSTAMHKRHRAATRAKTRRLEEAVQQNLETVHRPGDAFGKPTLRNKSHVTHGGSRRNVAPAADDD